MTKMGIWAIAAILAVPLMMIPVIAGGHLVFDSFSGTNDDANTSTVVSDMSLSFQGAEGNGLFGVVAFGEQNTHLAVTSHIGVADSEIPGGGADGTSHTHVLRVKVTENCANAVSNPAGLEGLAIKTASFKQIGILTFNAVGDVITVSDINARGVGGHLSGNGASFVLVPVSGDICIDIKKTIP